MASPVSGFGNGGAAFAAFFLAASLIFWEMEQWEPFHLRGGVFERDLPDAGSLLCLSATRLWIFFSERDSRFVGQSDEAFRDLNAEDIGNAGGGNPAA